MLFNNFSENYQKNLDSFEKSMDKIIKILKFLIDQLNSLRKL